MKRTVGKTSTVAIYQRGSGRWLVTWYDETGKRRSASRGTLAEARSIQKQKADELERHRRGRFTLDDRETHSLAREIAAKHGYTVLQALQEWAQAKGPSQALTLGEVIKKFLYQKSNLSPAYMEKFTNDLALIESYFGADRPLARSHSI